MEVRHHRYKKVAIDGPLQVDLVPVLAYFIYFLVSHLMVIRVKRTHVCGPVTETM